MPLEPVAPLDVSDDDGDEAPLELDGELALEPLELDGLFALGLGELVLPELDRKSVV